MADLSGRWALVTGGGRGIGKGIAIALAEAGADVILNDRRGSPDLAGTVEEIRALGRKCVAIEADVFSRQGCEGLVKHAIEAAGRIDILISNPAMNVRGRFLDLDPGDFERNIQGALAGGFHMSQLVGRHMVERGSGGKMVFISSVHAALPYANNVAYNAAKAGLNHMLKTIAIELTPHRINVNGIEPGWIDTPGEHEGLGDAVIEREGKKLPWGRMGQPSDIGKAAVFLVSDEADYVTSAILRVDGGFLYKDCREEI
jgi:glucose 1-dehydrogenase